VEKNKNHIDEDEDFPIRPYSQKELAAIYQCSRKSFYTWLRDLGEAVGPRVGRLYNPKQVRVIVASLGPPPTKLPRTGFD
jgi:hypothetical protein